MTQNKQVVYRLKLSLTYILFHFTAYLDDVTHAHIDPSGLPIWKKKPRENNNFGRRPTLPTIKKSTQHIFLQNMQYSLPLKLPNPYTTLLTSQLFHLLRLLINDEEQPLKSHLEPFHPNPFIIWEMSIQTIPNLLMDNRSKSIWQLPTL